MLTQPIALVPEAGGIPAADLARVSAALQMQVTRDLTPAWGLSATVDSFPRLEDVPVGYWPIIVSLCELGREAGAHLDENGQPYAQVEAKPDGSRWSLAASRACLEMLVNPFGDRTVLAPSLRSQQGAVEFALEVTSPLGGPGDAYFIHDVLVSDFCLPAYFSTRTRASHLTFCDALSAPFQLLPGGHLTWLDPVANEWWLRSYWDDVPVDIRLGAVDRRIVSVRELVRAQRPIVTRRATEDMLDHQARVARRDALAASQARANRLRALLGARLESQMLMSFDETRESETVAMPALTHKRDLPAAPAHGREEGREGPMTTLLERLDPPLLSAPDEPAQSAQPNSEIAAAAPASVPAVEIAARSYPSANDASPRMGLLLSASAGALLVVLAWYAQANTVRSSHATARPLTPAPAPVVIVPQVTTHQDSPVASEASTAPLSSPEKTVRSKATRKRDASASKKETAPIGSEGAARTLDDASEPAGEEAHVRPTGSLDDLISTRR